MVTINDDDDDHQLHDPHQTGQLVVLFMLPSVGFRVWGLGACRKTYAI